MALKIALYYPYIHLRSGIERTILEILKKSRHSWTVFTNFYQQDTTYGEFKLYRDKIRELRRISVSRSYINTIRAALIIARQRLPLGGFDLLWVHNEGLGSLINFNNRSIPVICFCHTPYKIIYDEELSKDYIRKNMLHAPLFLLFGSLLKNIDRAAFRRYAWCFCVSEEVKRRILSNRLMPADKLHVVYRGVDTSLFQGPGRYGDFFFHPARIKWWKNIELSIRAFNIFQERHREFSSYKLIIAGELYSTNRGYYKKLLELARSNTNIVFVIDPPEEQMFDLYRNCRAVLSTTLNEDFGLTILEAFSFSKPAIAVRRGGPAEIITDGRTGFLCPCDAGEYADSLYRLAADKDRAAEMGAIARKESLAYDWRNFITYMDDFLDTFLNRHP